MDKNYDLFSNEDLNDGIRPLYPNVTERTGDGLPAKISGTDEAGKSENISIFKNRRTKTAYVGFSGQGSESFGSTDRSQEATTERLGFSFSNLDIPESLVEKFDCNIAAIETLKRIESEKRGASFEEKNILSRYSGWGGLDQAFNDNNEIISWRERVKEIKNLLSNEEYSSARRSTLNAHYTNPEIAKTMWNILSDHLGFQGGLILEPSMGTGIFLGTRNSAEKTRVKGIELDSISGRIATLIHDDCSIEIKGFETYKMPEKTFDLVISNVPFGDYSLREPPSIKTPGLSGKESIHNFFIIKGLYGLKPKGIMAVITSRYTLDSLNVDDRKKMVQDSDFLGAIRLPEKTFKSIANTEVVTDIIFFRKREANQPLSSLSETFINTMPIELKDKANISTSINRASYFDQFPENILGEEHLRSSQYGESYTVTFEGDLSTLPDLIQAKARESLPQGLCLESYDADALVEFDTQEEQKNAFDVLFSTALYKSKAPGTILKGNDGLLYTLDLNSHPQEITPKNKTDYERLSLMIDIRDYCRSYLEQTRNNGPEKSSYLNLLNETYDKFLSEYGPLNLRKNKLLFLSDPDVSLLQALEEWDEETKHAQKSELLKGFSSREVKKNTITNIDDAILVSLVDYGEVNPIGIASIMNTSKETITEALHKSDLVFVDPQEYHLREHEKFIFYDAYISGNVREKLKLAEQLNTIYEGKFNKNIETLKKVQPPLMKPEDIILSINNPILDINDVADFISFKTGLSKNSVKLEKYSESGEWFIDLKGSSRLYTDRVSGKEIISSLLNGNTIKVFDKYKDSSGQEIRTHNLEESAKANALVEELNESFKRWIFLDPFRTEKIVDKWNELVNCYNTISPKHPVVFNNPQGSYFPPNYKLPFPLRSTQANAVWRIINQQNTLVGHDVGAGKTLTAIVSALELSRLNLAGTQIIVVPDNLIQQWGVVARQAYPDAKIFIADNEQWEKENRRNFLNKIAFQESDLVIMRDRSFQMIAFSPEYEQQYMLDKLNEYREQLAILEESGEAPKYTVKKIEKKIIAAQGKYSSLQEMKRDSGVVYFDDLKNVTALYIDEADTRKNLEFFTQKQNVLGLGSQTGSQRAFDTAMKIKYLQEQKAKIVFLTGTPISNTLVEAYTMMRYLQPEVLKKLGIENFDDWTRMFGEFVTSMVENYSGTGFKEETRFTKIVNVATLMDVLKQVWDIQSSEDLERDGVLVRGKNLPYVREVVVSLESNLLSESLMLDLARREANLKTKSPNDKDNMLAIGTDGNKASSDLRLIQPFIPDNPNGKLPEVCRNVAKIYKATEDLKYTQVIIFDKARSYRVDPEDSKKKFLTFDGNLYLKNTLMQLGVKENEIVITRGYDPEELLKVFEDCNKGKIRVLIGTTEQLGVGANFQRRLYALHQVDAPYRPRDITQRKGRIIRNGNLCPVVNIFTYVQKGTMDKNKWRILDQKAKSFNGLLCNQHSRKKVQEEEFYGSVRELTIDRQELREYIELERTVKKLRSALANHSAEKERNSKIIDNFPERIKFDADYLNNLKESLVNRTNSFRGDTFSISLVDKLESTQLLVFKDRQLAGEHLKKLFDEIGKGKDDFQKYVGDFANGKVYLRQAEATLGTNLQITWVPPNFVFEKDYLQNFRASKLEKHSGYEAVNMDVLDVKFNTLTLSLSNVVEKRLEQEISSRGEKLKVNEDRLAYAKESINKPFSKAEELEKIEARIKELYPIVLEENQKTNDRLNEFSKNGINWDSLKKLTSIEETKEYISKYYDLEDICEKKKAELEVQHPILLEGEDRKFFDPVGAWTKGGDWYLSTVEGSVQATKETQQINEESNKPIERSDVQAELVSSKEKTNKPKEKSIQPAEVLPEKNEPQKLIHELDTPLKEKNNLKEEPKKPEVKYFLTKEGEHNTDLKPLKERIKENTGHLIIDYFDKDLRQFMSKHTEKELERFISSIKSNISTHWNKYDGSYLGVIKFAGTESSWIIKESEKGFDCYQKKGESLQFRGSDLDLDKSKARIEGFLINQSLQKFIKRGMNKEINQGLTPGTLMKTRPDQPSLGL